MKKLIVKAEFIVTAYSPAISFSPEKWVKDGVETYALPEAPEEYVYHPAIDAKDEVAEVKEWKVIAETQGNDEQLAAWLEGDKFKYPEGYVVEYVDITADIEEANKLIAAKEEISKGINALAVFKVRVKNKGLSTTQIAMLFASPEIGKIISALTTGSLPLAKILIQNYAADGVIVSEDDKNAVISALA